MGFGVINAEGLYLNKNRIWFRDRVRQFFDYQAVKSPKLFDDDCSHTNTPMSLNRLRANFLRVPLVPAHQ
jgi:hypothetical protein